MMSPVKKTGAHAGGSAPALVLVGAGPSDALEALLPAAAAPLAARLALPMVRLAGEPAQALAALRHQGPALAWLTCDPGLWLESGGTWAEALGAWRQPTLTLIAGPQLACGQAAALVALLRQERVPLLGLLQWQGTWDAAARRSDGLPWLGGVEVAEPGGDPGAESGDVVAGDAVWLPVLRQRWRGLHDPEPA